NSHGDEVTALPKGFLTAGQTESSNFAAVEDRKRKLYGLQFNLFAARGVRDFGMELQAVEFPFSIFDRGKIRALRLSGSEKTFWQRRYFVAVAVPNIELIAQAIEQLRAVGDLQHSRAVFAAAREND